MPKKRDLNIYMTATGELKLSTQTIKSKKTYSRKQKHKGKDYE